MTENRARLLPTYRWDDWDDRTGQRPSDDKIKLRDSTARLLLDFARQTKGTRPPESVIIPIVDMNIAKRTLAISRAEQLVEYGQITRPPVSLIPTFMASGHAILGVEDGYMLSDHPSLELFAYNRLGKKSWLNRRFGEHCLTAIGFAHPHGVVRPGDMPTRVKAHSPTPGQQDGATGSEEWVIVSSKSPIATITENGRHASMISRVTGAVDLSSQQLSSAEKEAISQLAMHERFADLPPETVLGQKALLLDALERNDESPLTPFYPVLQTVYLTQLDQK